MKCIRRKNSRVIERVTNEEAFEIVTRQNAGSYEPKRKWKAQEREES